MLLCDAADRKQLNFFVGPKSADKAPATTLSHSKIEPLDKNDGPADGTLPLLSPALANPVIAGRFETNQGPAQPAAPSGASLLDQASKAVSDGVEAVKKSLS